MAMETNELDLDPVEEPAVPWWRRPRVWLVGAVVAALAAVLMYDALATSDTNSDDETQLSSVRDLAELSEETPGASDPAPDFGVVTLDGGSFVLSDHLAGDGRPVILNLWASWCLPCRTEMPAIDAFAAAHPEVKVVGVAVQDDFAAAAAFAEEIGVGYTLGFDQREEVSIGYQPLGLPATFLITADGTIARRIFGIVDEESLTADLPLLLGS